MKTKTIDGVTYRIPTKKELVQMAQEQHGDDGTCEIDDNAKISRGTDCPGAYVQAWVWVYYPEAT